MRLLAGTFKMCRNLSPQTSRYALHAVRDPVVRGSPAAGLNPAPLPQDSTREVSMHMSRFVALAVLALTGLSFATPRLSPGLPQGTKVFGDEIMDSQCA